MESATSGKNGLGEPTGRRRLLLAAGLIVLAAFLAYGNSFFGPRIMDDELATLKNPSIRQLWPIGPVLSPPAKLPVGGRPVLNLSFALNYAVSGKAVWSYHVFNLVVHMLAGLVLFGVLRRTLLQPVLRARFGADALPLAAAVSLLWVVHPAQTEAVTYISQRAESMMGLFYLLTIYGLIRASEAQAGSDRTRWSAICVVACVLGMLTKEVMVTAPVMALVYDRTFLAGSFREAWRRRWPLYAGLGATWLALVYALLDIDRRQVGWHADIDATSWHYALTECRAVFHYLTLTVWPHPLVVDFGTRLVTRPLDVLPQAQALAALLALTAIAFVRRPALGFAGVWFFLILAPTSSFIPLPGSPIAEHRLYLPLAAVLTLLVLGLYSWLGRNCRFVVLAAAAAFGVVTYERNEVYQSVFALNTDTLAKVPDNERVMTGMGGWYIEQGRLDDAVHEFQRVLALNPGDTEAHNGLGSALFRQGRSAEAMDQYREAIRLDPGFADAYYNLGEALSQANKMAEAIPAYEKAIQLNPDASDAHYNLGRALARTGKLREAVAQFQQALLLNPDDVDACVYLGGTLAQLGQFDAALTCFEHAVRLKPDSVEAHNDWGIVLALMGRKDGAEAQFREALRIDPDYFQARQNLAGLERVKPAAPGH